MIRQIFTMFILVITALPVLANPTVSDPWGIDANGFENLSTALESPSTIGKTVVISKPMVINSMTLSSDRHIKLVQGGRIDVASGHTFSFNSQAPEAGLYQIFAGSGSIVGLKEARPEWWATNAIPGTTDMTAAVQAAISSTIASDGGVILSDQYLLTSSVNIDRLVDGAAYDKYFTISSKNDGGFIINTSIPMFSSSITFTTAPVSQLIHFEGISFSATDNRLSAYVLDNARFLRTRFDKCNFQKIKLLSAPTVHTQSISLIGCNIRRFTGTFFQSGNYTYDFKFINNIVEAGENSLDITNAVGIAIIGSIIEGMSGTAIRLNGVQGATISGNYFEANGLDIDTSGTKVAYGIALTGNYFANAARYSVKWGNILGAISAGNWHTGSMHNFTTSTHDIAIQDVAQTSVANIEYPKIITGFSGTYTASLTGCNGKPTGTVRYSKTGNTVTIYLPTIIGTSNTTAATITGMPDTIRPARQQLLSCRVSNNGMIVFGLAMVNPDGTIFLGTDATGAGFTPSGVKGTQATTITFNLL